MPIEEKKEEFFLSWEETRSSTPADLSAEGLCLLLLDDLSITQSRECFTELLLSVGLFPIFGWQLLKENGSELLLFRSHLPGFKLPASEALSYGTFFVLALQLALLCSGADVVPGVLVAVFEH